VENNSAVVIRFFSSLLGAADLARLVVRDRRVAAGMARQGFDLQLTQYDERGRRATFYARGMRHSPASATGTG